MRRNTFLLTSVCVFLVSCSPISKETFENVYRAAKSIESATDLGVSYIEFNILLKKFSSEISIASDKAKTKQEKELIKAYSEALATYLDSTTLWKYKIDWHDDYHPADCIVVLPSIKPIIRKYDFPIVSNVKGRRFGRHMKFDCMPKESIQIIWSIAEIQLEKANRLYLGK